MAKLENNNDKTDISTPQPEKNTPKKSWWARLLTGVFWSVLAIIIAIMVAINLPVTKNWIAQKAIDFLNKDLKTQFAFEKIDINFFGDVVIHNLTAKDYKDNDFIKAKELYANSDWFALITNSRNIKFEALTLKDLDLKVITYKGDSTANFIKFIELFDNGKPADPNKPPFELKTRIGIENSKVSIINENSGEAGKWLNAGNVNISIPELYVKGSDVSGQINRFSFVAERWGKKHFLDTFSTNFSLNKKALTLKDLVLKTDKTLLQGQLKFNLNDGSWADFADKVRLEMNLDRGSQINGYDLSYFVTNWDNYQPVNVSGTMDGTLNNFSLNHFVLGNQNVNIATKNISFKDLLNGDFKIKSKELSTDFTYQDLKAMLPSFIAKKLKNFADDFGRLKYNGDLEMTPKYLSIPSGELITGVGQAKIKSLFLNEYSTETPKYKGQVELKNLNVATITKNPQVGLLSGNFNLEGESFDINKMRLKTQSHISSIEILDKKISNITLDGVLNKKTYNGIINVNDQQAQANVKGLIDFSTSKIKADVLADIKHLNISHFTGQKTTQIAKGQINGKMEMSNLNDLVMDTKIDNLAFTNGNEHYNLPNAELKAYFNNGNRVLQIDAPNILNGRIAGKYNLAHLPDMLQNGIGKILVGSPVKKNFKGESFNMEIFAHQTLINLFEPNLQINDGVRVSGSYEGNDNTLVLNVDAKKLLYLMTKTQEVTEADRALAESNPNYRLPQATTTTDSLAVDNILVKINTANREEPIFTKIERLKMGENVFKNISLTGKNEDNKVMHISANFLHGSPQDEMAEQMKPYAINLNQSTNTNGDYIFKFSPTQVKFNEVAWNIDTSEDLNHSITYQKKTGHILVHNLRIFSDNSSLMLKDALFKSGKDFHIDGDVQNLQLAKLMEMQQSGNQMDIQGVANGNFNITMDKSHLQPVIDLDIDNITMSGKEVGKIVLNAKNSNTANVFDVDAKIISDGILGKNNLQLSGTINNNTSRPTLNLKANLDEFDLTFAQQFVKDVFGNIRGKASGDLNISGALNDIDYNGDIALKNFGMKINFIGVDYTFEDTIVNLSKGRAILNDIGIKDGRSNSAGSISGVIDFETLSTMAVQLIMRADNLLVLNTKQKDFDLFWGRVYGKGNLYVSGLVSALSFTTDLQEPFRALNGSQFTFNAGSTSSVNEFGMLRFLKRESDGQVKVQEKEKTGANLNLDFNIAVEKGTTVNVILPQDVGNITVKGDANPLRFRMFPNGNISMNGSYMVDSGTFVSKAILERTFQIQRGSTMRWDGNAMTPALDIKAQYNRMVTNTGQYLGTSLPAVNIELGVDITGSLNGPKIGFNISAPDLSSQMKETLSSKLNSENEKIIQFGSILLMNSFNVQTGTSSGFDFDATSAAESTAFNLAFKQLGSVLNTISNQFQINLDYLKGDANSISNTGDRANANVDFFISPRVTLKTGLGVPITKGTTTADTNYLSGEGIVEYDWSKKNDKSRLFRIYSRPSNIGLVGGNAGNGANQSYGVGVVYSKSFDTIFKQKNKKKNTDSIKINNNSTKNDTLK